MSELQAQPPHIEVICGTPRRLKGEYSFDSFQKLCKWMYREFPRPRALAGHVLETLAKDCHFPRTITWYCDLEAESSRLNYPQYEELAEEAITIGCVNNQDVLRLASSRGPTLDGRVRPDCVAPSERILCPRAQNTTTRDIHGDHYGFFDLTSFATPHVTGIYALLKQAFAKARPAQIKELQSQIPRIENRKLEHGGMWPHSCPQNASSELPCQFPPYMLSSKFPRLFDRFRYLHAAE